MKVMATGKEHRSGVAKKTGKPHNSTVVYYTHAKNGVEGAATASVWPDTATYPLGNVAVGKPYNLGFDLA